MLGQDVAVLATETKKSNVLPMQLRGLRTGSRNNGLREVDSACTPSESSATASERREVEIGVGSLSCLTSNAVRPDL